MNELPINRNTPKADCPPAAYEATQRQAFATEVRNGLYGVSHTYKGRTRDFFLRGLAEALGDRWSSSRTLRVLECGVGDGAWLESLVSERNWGHTQISGFDLTPEMVALAQQRFSGREHPNLNIGFLRVGDITKEEAYSQPESMATVTPPFDLVYCYDVIQQLPKRLRMIAVERMLAAAGPTGVVVIFDKHKYSIHGLKMAMRKWITAHTPWKPVPVFYLNARYPSMHGLARLAARRWHCRTSLFPDPKHEHFALVLYP